MHLEFSSSTHQCKIFKEDGTLWRTIPMEDAAVNGPGFGFRGRCPRGTYDLGRPVPVHDESMGLWFTPLLEVPGRRGIGIHGGGSALGIVHAFDPLQPLLKTLGCLRVHNADNALLAPELTAQHDAGTPCRITIAGP